MISSWIAYLYNLLPVALRQSRFGQLVLVLLSPAQSASDELSTYTADARLRSAATWQVQWLEKLLTDALGYAVSIAEADGLPIDFIVSGVSYTDQTLAHGLLNRYKLAGKSYTLSFADVEVTGQWLNPLCAQTDVYVITGQWLNPLCAQEPIPTITFNVELSWASAQQGQFDGLSGSVRVMNSATQVVATEDIVLYSKGELIQFTLPQDASGYSVDFNAVYANLDGQAVTNELLWSLNLDMSNAQSHKSTPLYTEGKTIYVEVSPFE